ncbi:hypothetical protein AAU61_13395 [Desulfocarbo indianensis]|nr:hypothetical protein AAU61_13395 [Desulfocarbo indianensis]
MRPVMYFAHLSRKNLEKYASNDLAFLGVDLSRISTIFLDWVCYFYTNRIFASGSITREIEIIEAEQNNSCVKKAALFKHPPLKGLTHKHFTDAQFVINNLNAYLGVMHGGNDNLDKIIKKVFESNQSGMLDEETIHKLAYLLTFQVYENRQKDKTLTGEWIIYQEHEGENYYLTIGFHEEDDNDIYKRVLEAYKVDFPFLPQKGG